MVTRFVALVALLGIGACTFPEVPLPPGEQHILVHAILDPSSRIQVIELSSTHGDDAFARDADSAMVVVTTPAGQELVARQDSVIKDPAGNRYPLPLYFIHLDEYAANLIPGGTYQLRIVTRKGVIITGTTTIPLATPAALETTTNFFLRKTDTLRVSWPKVSGATTYEAQIWTEQRVSNTYTYRSLNHTRFVADSLTLAGTAKNLDNGDVFPTNTTVRLEVLAVDRNYYDYYRDLGDIFAGAAPSHLTGGIGVFGAIVPIVQRKFDVR